MPTRETDFADSRTNVGVYSNPNNPNSTTPAPSPTPSSIPTKPPATSGAILGNQNVTNPENFGTDITSNPYISSTGKSLAPPTFKTRAEAAQYGQLQEQLLEQAANDLFVSSKGAISKAEAISLVTKGGGLTNAGYNFEFPQGFFSTPKTFSFSNGTLIATEKSQDMSAVTNTSTSSQAKETPSNGLTPQVNLILQSAGKTPEQAGYVNVSKGTGVQYSLATKENPTFIQDFAALQQQENFNAFLNEQAQQGNKVSIFDTKTNALIGTVTPDKYGIGLINTIAQNQDIFVRQATTTDQA
ncbi:MAG: hypothetical protein KGJ07_10005, partial [Patescibacteria group bacterium]|nr:hypothetical protein [Patescibacteria group bacterium]